MANARRKRKKEFEISNSHLISIGLIGLGLIYLLSLISFSLNDLPTWVPFSHTTNPTRPATNFIGPPGAVWAGISFYTFGITSYLIPVMLIWLGSKRLFKLENLSKFEIVGFGLFLISGSCLLHYQSWFLQSGHFNISGTGGIIGEFIGEKLTGMTGNVGSSLIMLTAYCSGGMLITRVHPSQIVKVGINSLKSFNTWREDRIFSKADETKKLLIQKKKLDKEQRRIEKKIDKTLLEEQTVTDVQSKENNQIEEIVADPDINTETILEENIKIEENNTELSEPKIFDASFRSPEDSLQKKPSIAEVLAANKKSQNNKSGNDFSAPKEIQFPGYQLPDIELLNYDAQTDRKPTDKNLLIQTQKTIVETLDHFNVSVSAGDITRGPTITRYEIYPSKGLRVNRITALEADIARATKAERINILAPIPGKDTVGIEIANNEKVIVPLRELFDDPDFMDPKHKIPIALGKDVYGKAVIGDLAKMPHLLVAGTTGSGKSVGVNVMILSLLYKSTPEDVRMIMIDPKMLELSVYEGIPHLLAEVVTDMKEAANALRWCVGEMERRYRLMSALGVRNLKGYNAKVAEAIANGTPIKDPLWKSEESMDPEAPDLEKLPAIVVVVDEFADMMMIVGKKVEELIARIAQKARAAGIHLVLATQRPSVDVITGLIKANIPTRIAFQVSSKIDSRTILDQQGAETLLGMGDMLYLPPGSPVPTRVHGAFVDDHEVHAVVADWQKRGEPEYIDEILNGEASAEVLLPGEQPEGEEQEFDAFYDEAVAFVTETRRASVSSVQRKFRIGYNRAARLVEQMEMSGVVSAQGHNGNREVLAPPPPKD